MSKILVTYYSKTKNTKKLAQKISDQLNCEIDEIIDQKDRSGIIGWIGGGKDAILKKETDIRYEKNPKDYDIVIIGTPVWAGTQVPATRQYLKTNNIKKIAFFCTYGGSESKTFYDMQEISSAPIATLGLKDKEIDNISSIDKINEFIKEIRSA